MGFIVAFSYTVLINLPISFPPYVPGFLSVVPFLLPTVLSVFMLHIFTFSLSQLRLPPNGYSIFFMYMCVSAFLHVRGHVCRWAWKTEVDAEYLPVYSLLHY